MKKIFFLLFISNIVFLLLLESCNNPLNTREPQNPGSEGASIKPANSPENVLYNLEASFEGLSIQDYLDVFSDDFAFHPDTDDSIGYEEDFINGWGIEKETEFANNFLQRQNFREDIEGSPIELTSFYDYKAGQDMYDYTYNMFIIKKDTTVIVEGRAWLYLREETEGKWSIYNWVDIRYRVSSMTWGVLRAQNI